MSDTNMIPESHRISFILKKKAYWQDDNKGERNAFL